MQYYRLFFLICFLGIGFVHGQRDMRGYRPDPKMISLGKSGKCTAGIIQPLFTLSYYDTLHNKVNMIESVSLELKNRVVSPVNNGFRNYYNGYPPEQLPVENAIKQVNYLISLIDWLPQEYIRDTIDTYSRTTLSHVVACKSAPLHFLFQFREGKLSKIISLSEENHSPLLLEHWQKEIEKYFSDYHPPLPQEAKNIDIELIGIFEHQTIDTKLL